MNELKSVLIVNIIFLVLMFFFLVYPGIEFIGNMPPIFSLIIRVLVFIAITSFITFFFLELKKFSSNCKKLELEKKTREKKEKQNYIKTVEPRFQVDPEENYQVITKHLLELVKSTFFVQTVYLYFFNHEKEEYILQDFLSSFDVKMKNQFNLTLPVFGEIHNSKIPIIYDTSKMEKESLVHYEAVPKVRSIMLIPIFLNDFIGFIGLDSVEKKSCDQNDFGMAEEFSKMFTANIWQVDTIQKQKDNIEFFKELTHINSHLPLNITDLELFKKIQSVIKKFFQYDKLTIATMKNDDEQDLSVEYVDGYETDFGIGARISINAQIVNQLFQKQKLHINNYDVEGIKHRFFPDDLEAGQMQTCIGVLLEFDRGKKGILVLEHKDIGHYRKEELRILELFGKNLNEIINRIYVYRSMKNLALVDGLTSIYNRRAFEEHLQIEIERARRYNNNLTILMLDLDKFKRINDIYGHLYGDYVLKKIGLILRSSVRTVDTVSRYGGEEFAVILINTDKNSCINTADRIRSNIEEFIFQKDDMKEHMTISIGVSDYPADGDDMQSIMACADQAMYQSKKVGGNKVSMYKHN